MPRGTKFKPEEIIAKLREAEVELARGKKIPEVCKQIGVTEQTYYRWKKEYGGLRMDQAKRLQELEKENSLLKRLLADADLDKAILREVASNLTALAIGRKSSCDSRCQFEFHNTSIG